MIVRALALAGGLGIVLCLLGPTQAQRQLIEPAFSIWDVEIGQPISQVPVADVVELACGTNGGPPSIALRELSDFKACPPEPTGLREVHFAYDDEMDYIARAMESEFRVLQGGTSIYAHPVILSVLVDDEGVVRGIRIVTDDRVGLRERRVAVNLARNLKARFGRWSLVCEKIPPRPGENPVGNQFIHEVCIGADPEGSRELRLEASYLRKRGQEAVNRETQEVNAGYFESKTRIEIVEAGIEPATDD